MSEVNTNLLNYYASPGPMTDPGEYAHLFDDLPTEIPALVEVVQGLLTIRTGQRAFWATFCMLLPTIPLNLVDPTSSSLVWAPMTIRSASSLLAFLRIS